VAVFRSWAELPAQGSGGHVHIDWAIVVAGAIVGFTVGLTGMGGGALMTPILVIFFAINPTSAVSNDLLAAMIMKPVGGGVHALRKTVRWELVKWLCVSSIPTAFAAVFVLHSLGDAQRVQDITKVLLGATLLLAASAMIFKAWLQGKRAKEARFAGLNPSKGGGAIKVKILPTILVGALGGTLVGLTSVGSGSIVIVCMMLLYPELRGPQLVGTDLMQAIPLVGAAAIAHIAVGDLTLGLSSMGLFWSIVIGGIPAVYIGARLSSKAPDGIIRPALVFVLTASALKLLNMSTDMLGIVLVAFALIALPIWGAIDAAAHPEHLWAGQERPRSWWIRIQAVGSLFLVGFVAAIRYFWKVRPSLNSATEQHALVAEQPSVA
jgi:uncharacterized protein